MLGAAALYAALSLVMVAPGLVPGRTLSSSDLLWTVAPWSATKPAAVPAHGANPENADSVSAFGPLARDARATLPSLALWNPYIGAGRPLMADMQSQVLSPFSVPAYVLPYWWSQGLIAALKLFIAALGTFALARVLAIRPGGALIAGLAFGLGLYMVTWLSWPLTSVWALLPWLLVAIARVVRAPDTTGVVALAVVAALTVLAGHPESTFHGAVVAVLFALLLASRERDGRWRRLGIVALGAVAGACLAAIVALPFLELVRHSGDLADRTGQAPKGIASHDVLGLFFPEYWGRPTQFETQAFINVHAFYAGALPTLLAGIAIVVRPTRERIAVVLTGAVALMVVLGFWPAFQIVNALPGFDQTYNTRLGVFVVLAIALLAGWGADEVLDARSRTLSPRANRILVGALAAAVVAPVVIVAHRFRPGQLGHAIGVAAGVSRVAALDDLPHLLPTAAMLDWLVLAGAGAALIVVTWRGRLSPNVAVALMVALTAVDMLRFGIGENPSIPRSHATQPATPAIRFLQTRTPARFVGLQSPSGQPSPIPADAAMDYGLQDARSYDYPIVARYDRLWRAAVAPPALFTPPTTIAGSDRRALRALGLLGVRSLLQRPGDPRLALPIVYSGRDGRIYDNPGAMPRAWVVDHQQPVAGGAGAQLRAIEDPAFRPAATAVVARPVAGIATGPGTTARPVAARVGRYAPQRVEVDATARRRSLVVLSDVYYPGWKATVDGHAAPIEQVDYLLRGVSVGPGRHRIVYRYEPGSVRFGAIISVLTALTLIGGLVVARRRRRGVPA